ncbi:MAG: shikimate dehydrogenase [Chloroflexi bacterium]|nr:shikimate dehydrogenase [Chloroflexota bacterium]
MKYLYLLGYPLGHSISPAMQNAALRERKIRATRYVKNPMPPEKMREMILALRAPHCLGANVTVPHKQAIMPHLDELTDLAREIGAVNTILKRADANGIAKLVGDNTDAYGFLQALRVRKIRPQNACVAIIGAGGAAAAAAYALAQEGAREIILLNRTLARSVELADRLNRRFPALALAINDWDALERMHLIINATSVGMAPKPDESPLPAKYTIPRSAVVFDLVYNPPATKFLREAQARGARVIGGLEMLVYQGARAFELWTGQRAPVRVMRDAASKVLQDMQTLFARELAPSQVKR